MALRTMLDYWVHTEGSFASVFGSFSKKPGRAKGGDVKICFQSPFWLSFGVPCKILCAKMFFLQVEVVEAAYNRSRHNDLTCWYLRSSRGFA